MSFNLTRTNYSHVGPDDLFVITVDPDTMKVSIILKFKLINPSSMQPSSKVTDFVYGNVVKRLEKEITWDFYQGENQRRTIEYELFMYTMEMIEKGAIHSIGDIGFIVDRSWLFSKMIYGDSCG